MKLRASVVGVLAAGALVLAGCTGSADDVVVVTEVVTEEVAAGASSYAPADAATAPLSGTRYRLVEDVERFSEGTETYLFSSPRRGDRGSDRRAVRQFGSFA